MFRKYLPIFALSLLISQDVAGTYQLYGLYIIHQDIARYDATINVSDRHDLGVTLPVSQINAGEVYKTTYQGPYGHLYAQLLNVILNANFNEDGSAEITEGSYYPTEELSDDCISTISILPITDNLLYSSNLNANLTIPLTNIIGYIPDENPTDQVAENGIPIGYDSPLLYGGTIAGSASLAQSSVFDYFPATPTQPTLCDGFGNCFDVILSDGTVLNGGDPLPGYTGGYVLKGDLASIAPNENDCADLYMEWHAIDGNISQSGLGDIIGEDEDGDGTDFDGLGSKESLMATYLKPSCNYDYPIFGDVESLLPTLGIESDCFDRLDIAVEGYVVDLSLTNWGSFVTFNALSEILEDDSSYDFDGVNGRIIFEFEPMCIQNINVRHIMLEFINIGEGETCLDSGCSSFGDMNGDDGWNVLDIVALANCVLASNCSEIDNGCAGDMNGDGGWNVLDIVALANCVLASNCNEI